MAKLAEWEIAQIVPVVRMARKVGKSDESDQNDDISSRVSRARSIGNQLCPIFSSLAVELLILYTYTDVAH